MTPANKILTVAYGTFSCTLEGFDDPFSTMTDIAEYFRDLAAEDRFFGAEPPTPDMAMLRTIAEARAKRAIEASPDEGGVTLRPAAAGPAVETVEDAPSPVDTPEIAAEDDAVVADEAGEIEETPVEMSESAVEEEQPVEQVEEIAVADQDADEHEVAEAAEMEDDSAAAKLARIRDAVDSEREARTEASEFEDIEDADPAFGADAFAAAFEDDATNEEVLSETPDPVIEDDSTEMADAAVEEEAAPEEHVAFAMGFDTADETDETDEQQAPFAEYAAAEEPVTEDAAIENAFQDLIADEAEEDDMDAVMAAVSDEDADDITDDAAQTVHQMDESAWGRTAWDPAETAEEASEVTQEEPVHLAEAAYGEDVDEVVDEEDQIADRVEESVWGQTAWNYGDTAEDTSDVTPEEPANLAEAVSDDVAEAGEEAPEIAAFSEDQASEEEAVSSEPEAEPSAVQPIVPRRVRVRKVRRPDIAAVETDAADRDEPAAETAESDAPTELTAIGPETTGFGSAEAANDDVTAFDADRSEDQDDDRMAESAAIQAADTLEAPQFHEDHAEASSDFAADDARMAFEDDMPEFDEDHAAASDDEAEEEVAEPVESHIPADRDMERLFAATDSRFSGEDMSRRHANISHLKAAVAARRADGPYNGADDDQTGAYREDLASTVRPRRAAMPSDEEKTIRSERPAPLMLVSEQRVETEIPADTLAEAVHPRRTTRLSEETSREDAILSDVTEPEMDAPGGSNDGPVGDFEQFAADLGAVDLPDILEAAAVYSAKVMGNERFSRPRLLHLAAEAVDDMSREDGLRGFGQLLRDGTIRKVSRGEFALGGDSRYAASADRQVG
ncbi:MAG: hypothetical protein AAGF30_05115 [Pseudomonadota bacterium]